MHARRQSASIPGWKKRSWSLSLIKSVLKCPFYLCVSRAVWNPDDVGWHSVLGTRSDTVLLIHHSLSPSIMKPLARWIAHLQSAIESPVDLPNRCWIMGEKKISSWKWSSSSWCPGAPGEVDIYSTSFWMPFQASQSGNTDQKDPSASVRGRFRHILLKPSAMGLLMPRQWQISTMLWLSIDSCQRLWWLFILSLSRQSQRA